MRAILFFLPLVILASPAAAQAPVASKPIPMPPELTDMKWADRLTDAMTAMSKAFLDMPIGEVQAAIEGRDATPADRRRTLRSECRLSEGEIRQQVEAVRPAMQAGMKALASALPAMMEGLSRAQEELDRATANMPQPGYPKQ